MGLIEHVVARLPGSVAAVDHLGEGNDDGLWPDEVAAIAGSVPSRRSAYAAARRCAREALADIGLPSAAILNRSDRSPVWPPGTVGSLTHTEGYCAAAVARSEAIASVGIDAEPDLPLPAGVDSLVLTSSERTALARLPVDGPCWARLVFTAKEATFKAWHPLTGLWLGFDDATVEVHPLTGTFAVQLLIDGLEVSGRPVRRLTGRWVGGDGYLVSAVTVPHQPSR